MKKDSKGILMLSLLTLVIPATTNAFTNIRDISGTVQTLITNAPGKGGVEIFVQTDTGICVSQTQGDKLWDVSIASLIVLRKSQREQIPVTIECAEADSAGIDVNPGRSIIIAY